MKPAECTIPGDASSRRAAPRRWDCGRCCRDTTRASSWAEFARAMLEGLAAAERVQQPLWSAAHAQQKIHHSPSHEVIEERPRRRRHTSGRFATLGRAGAHARVSLAARTGRASWPGSWLTADVRYLVTAAQIHWLTHCASKVTFHGGAQRDQAQRLRYASCPARWRSLPLRSRRSRALAHPSASDTFSRDRTRNTPCRRCTTCDEAEQRTERAQRRGSNEVEPGHTALKPVTQDRNRQICPDSVRRAG